VERSALPPLAPAGVRGAREEGAPLGRAAPGSLEEFLVERYQLFSVAAEALEVREDLSVAAGLTPLGRPDSCQWSPGVSVEFEHLRPA
jgi:uncharacterized protein YqjF (DUF2071 family)